jgi:hypothetical protein
VKKLMGGLGQSPDTSPKAIRERRRAALLEEKRRQAELDVDALVVRPSPGSLAAVLGNKKRKADK